MREDGKIRVSTEFSNNLELCLLKSFFLLMKNYYFQKRKNEILYTVAFSCKMNPP